MRAVANVVAGPAKTVVVVCVFIQSPSIFFFINPPDATARSPDVIEAVAAGIDADMESIVCVGTVAEFTAGHTGILVGVRVIFVPLDLFVFVVPPDATAKSPDDV